MAGVHMFNYMYVINSRNYCKDSNIGYINTLLILCTVKQIEIEQRYG